MVQGFINGQTVENLWELTRKIKKRAMGSIFGQMDVFMQGIG